ncbi:MAG: hypothetical protein MR471_02380 [Clostridia bacterium]|nr:hypothetical protein [Clostridia bacterium]MDY3784528.1 hypothetical protein [Eubacteriales bacterium]
MKKQSAAKPDEKNTTVRRKTSDKRSTAIMILCVSLAFIIILAALIFSFLLPSLAASGQLKAIKETLNAPENIDGFVITDLASLSEIAGVASGEYIATDKEEIKQLTDRLLSLSESLKFSHRQSSSVHGMNVKLSIITASDENIPPIYFENEMMYIIKGNVAYYFKPKGEEASENYASFYKALADKVGKATENNDQ